MPRATKPERRPCAHCHRPFLAYHEPTEYCPRDKCRQARRKLGAGVAGTREGPHPLVAAADAWSAWVTSAPRKQWGDRIVQAYAALVEEHDAQFAEVVAFALRERLLKPKTGDVTWAPLAPRC